MKSPLQIALLALILLVPLTASAQMSPFRLRVEQTTKSDNDKFSKKQQRSLKIFVSNSSKEQAELLAKYVFFGRELKGSDVVKIDEGEKAVSVAPLATAMVESGIASTSYQEQHSTGGGNRAGKKVEATGHKFLGFGVQLYQGDKMVAEYYDPPSGKDQWSKAYPAKLPTAAPKR